MNFEKLNEQDLWELKKKSVLESMIQKGENYLSKINKITKQHQFRLHLQ